MNDLMLKRCSANLTANSIAYKKSATNNSIAHQTENFGEILKQRINEQSQVDFTKHATSRVVQRNIDITKESLERLNEGVKIAEKKGLDAPLILVDKTAFIVNIKNNKVITTISGDELKGNVITNIDGTVII